MIFKHTNNRHFYLERNIDKMVFGEYRAVTELRKIRKYRIKNGDIQVRFCGKWQTVEECNSEHIDRVNKIAQDLAESKGYVYGQAGEVKII